jgi:peptide/nickel transport system substrate-binding protein
MNEFSRRFGIKTGAAIGALAAAGTLRYVTYAEPRPIGTPEEASGASVGGEIIIGVSELGDTLDPHKTGSAAVSTIVSLCGDRLIAEDFDGNYVPALAKEWTVSDDGLVWTFTLREDVKFQDGTPFDANSAKFSFDRILDPATKSITAGGLVGSMTSVEVLGPYQFKFTLKESFAPLLDSLTAGVLSFVSQPALEAAGDDFGRKPVLTGPWMVDEWREGDRIILKRNPDYAWAAEYLHQDPPGAFVETITFQSIIEEASRIAAFEAGEIQQVTIPAVDVERIQESDEFWIIDYWRKGVVFLEFNVTQAPFDDVNVRRALNFAVNKQDVMDAAVEGYGQIAYGFLSPTIPGYWDGIAEYAPAYDPEQAKTLLAEAGWVADGDGKLSKDGQPLKFTALNLPTDAWGRAAQVIQSQLGDVGIEMEIQQLEFATLLDEAKTASHQAEMMGYTYSDPDIAYLWFHSAQAGTGLNMSHIKDPELDAMIMTGRSTMDPAARNEIYAEIQRYVSDLALWIPLWIDQYFIGYSKNIQNAVLHPDNYAVYYDAWITE